MISTAPSSTRDEVQTRKTPLEVAVKRSDPVYMAHGYLTKVPVAAIQPFLEAFTEPGDLVLDPFAGSGMTGVAAAMLGRRAVLHDVSVLGKHIGTNYVRLVPNVELLRAGAEVVKGAYNRIGCVYQHRCERCSKPAELSRRIWSLVIACPTCERSVTVYRALEASKWRKSDLRCPECKASLTVRGGTRRGEEPVVDTIWCACSRVLRDQDPSEPIVTLNTEGLDWPDVAIEPHRQMFQASALSRNNLTTTGSFFSQRNIAALAALREEIRKFPQEDIRSKLLFTFTAILTRASKRYQWSRKRPLNAANQNYYVAPIFYEWNVFDLFRRKLEAVGHSDDFIREARGDSLFSFAEPIDVRYQLGSAEKLDLPDRSVDYVFTDPPFGSNIFYSDMNLFHEAWLGEFTDSSVEAVVDRSGPDSQRRSAERYEDILTRALSECCRVLKDDGRLSLVFSNSNGDIWALVQRVIRNAGFVIDEDGISLLDKGQRSVKGLNSGYEAVVTVDLVITMRKRRADDELHGSPTQADVELEIDRTLANHSVSDPSRVYLHVIRRSLRDHMDLAGVSFRAVVESLVARGYRVDPASGHFITGSQSS